MKLYAISDNGVYPVDEMIRDGVLYEVRDTDKEVDTRAIMLVRSLDEHDSETDEPLYWSNMYGWVLVGTADRFTVGEALNRNLPIGGKWEVH